MINRKEVRDNRNIIIGYCEEYSDRINAQSFKAGLVGFYIKSSNITFDRFGKIYCYGDATSELVRAASK